MNGPQGACVFCGQLGHTSANCKVVGSKPGEVPPPSQPPPGLLKAEPNSVACCQAEPAVAKPVAKKTTWKQRERSCRRKKKEEEKKEKEAEQKQAALQKLRSSERKRERELQRTKVPSKVFVDLTQLLDSAETCEIVNPVQNSLNCENLHVTYM